MAEAAIPISTPGSGTPRFRALRPRHHQRNHDRQEPDRRRPEEGAPQPDRHHRGHVVEPEERMPKAANETTREPVAGVAKAGAADTAASATSKPVGKNTERTIASSPS